MTLKFFYYFPLQLKQFSACKRKKRQPQIIGMPMSNIKYGRGILTLYRIFAHVRLRTQTERIFLLLLISSQVKVVLAHILLSSTKPQFNSMWLEATLISSTMSLCTSLYPSFIHSKKQENHGNTKENITRQGSLIYKRFL